MKDQLRITTKWVQNTNRGNYLYLGNVLVSGYEIEKRREGVYYKAISYWFTEKHIDFYVTTPVLDLSTGTRRASQLIQLLLRKLAVL